MLGFSLQKIMVLAAILGAVWWGYKWISRLEQVRDARDRLKKTNLKKTKTAEAHKRSAEQVEEMVECPACHTYQVLGRENICANCGETL